MKKVKIFSMMIIMLVVNVACHEDDSLQLIASQEAKNEIKTLKQDDQEVHVAARKANSNCSFKNLQGEELEPNYNVLQGTVSPGKYYVKLNGSYASAKYKQLHLDKNGGDGTVIVRVVGQKTHWWGHDEWQLLDGCHYSTGKHSIATNPLGDEAAEWDYLYFEIIVLDYNVNINCVFSGFCNIKPRAMVSIDLNGNLLKNNG